MLSVVKSSLLHVPNSQPLPKDAMASWRFWPVAGKYKILRNTSSTSTLKSISSELTLVNRNDEDYQPGPDVKALPSLVPQTLQPRAVRIHGDRLFGTIGVMVGSSNTLA